jgi:hypothetical protein
MIWYVHRRGDGSIASAHSELRPGYAEEEVADTDPELATILNPPKPEKPLTAEELYDMLLPDMPQIEARRPRRS